MDHTQAYSSVYPSSDIPDEMQSITPGADSESAAALYQQPPRYPQLYSHYDMITPAYCRGCAPSYIEHSPSQSLHQEPAPVMMQSPIYDGYQYDPIDTSVSSLLPVQYIHTPNPSPTSVNLPPSSPLARNAPGTLNEDDERYGDGEEPLPPNASDNERYEWRKRRNTRLAKLSRRRKAEYTQKLEETVETLRREKEVWRTRALTLRQLLRSHNLPCPDFTD